MSRIVRSPIVVDVETTGFGKYDRVLEIAAIRLDPETGEIIDEYDTLVQPGRDVGHSKVHGITPSMLELAPTFEEILGDLSRRLQGQVLVAHNLPFDQRFLRQEFDRCGVLMEAGDGICTLRATRQKLAVACEQHGIPLEFAHRALADARATAGLLRHLGLHRLDDHHEPIRIGYIGRRPTKRTLRRDLTSEGPAMPRIVSRAHYPHGDEAVSLYLDAIDHALDDGVLDDEERSEMQRIAEEYGIPESVRQQAHRDYFDAVVDAAKRDGVITPSERRIIENLARQLGIQDAASPDVTRLPEIMVLEAGSRVCFTGRVVLGDTLWERSRLETVAEGRGYEVAASVSRRRCDLLVAADRSSSSAKARAARRLGIPIWSAAEFLERSR